MKQKEIFSIIKNITAGCLIIIVLILLIFFVNQIPIDNFLIQYIFYPSSLGSERILELNLDFKNTFGQFKFTNLVP